MRKEKQKKSTMAGTILVAFMAMMFFVPFTAMAGDIDPPSGAVDGSGNPVPTMKTLDVLPSWSKVLPANERFVLVLNNEAVLDKETGLVWAKNANIAGGIKTWEDAVLYCRNRNIGNRKGWRLPSVEELSSLLDVSQFNPALPSGYSSFFDNVQSIYYWSATTTESNTGYAWGVRMGNGSVSAGFKSDSYYVWPVRGGSGPILVPHTP